MKPMIRTLLALVFAFSTAASAQPLTDAQVKKQMIAESMASYSGACPCPYNITSNGSRCGGRSAYSRAGGAATLCYEHDITPAMVEAWRAANGG